MEKGPSRGAGRRLAVPAAAAGLALAVAVLAPMLTGGGTPPAEPLLEERGAFLAHRVELAREGRLHLALDAGDSALVLLHGGAELRRWPLQRVEAEDAGALLARGSALAGWRTHRWEGGSVVPAPPRERRTIVSAEAATPDPAGAVEWIPPLPEEEAPPPRRFEIRFPEGLTVVVHTQGPDSLLARPGALTRLGRGLEALGPAAWDRYRVHLVLEAVEAGALYRAWPGEAALVTLLPAEGR